MGFSRHYFSVALRALLRNRAQAALAVLGVCIGVGALVTSLALGRGAQEAIADQLLAAGANMIVVTAGNYQAGRSHDYTAPADHASLLHQSGHYYVANLRRQGPALSSALFNPADNFLFRPVHFENDPMAVHDHPTAKERLGDTMAGLGAAATLTIEDARAIRDSIPGVHLVVSGVHENARLTVENAPKQRWLTRMHGTEEQLPEVRPGWSLPYGRFFNRNEVDDSAQVLVLGRVAAERLFGAGVDPVGETVLLWNQPFEVVGVVDSRSWASTPAVGDDQFDAFYVPVTTVHQLLNLSMLNTITVTTRAIEGTSQVADQIQTLLRDRHGITESMPDDFTVKSQAEQVLGKGLSPDIARIVSGNLARVDDLTVAQLSGSLQRTNRTMLALLAGVAAVSLLVGGIGVMNLLLLSVTQRTREIGLRMALGARPNAIATQFLIESLLLSLCGGVLGALLGLISASSLEGVLQWSTVVSPLSTVLAIGVAALLGIAAGVYPATKASRLDPIGALHHE
ncbi:FtsX-like permease family protein [Parahaliea maris]|uniref:FtsX-like permease family protein n=1 Tax=Parahaliea maris TaxID=2716870 RepID=A0A5C8ZWC0_9GAMM|nr:ABC transporter permease [Parahaliea maris]TXS92054.1 FtsX-like permease family protein [Parahaliea maris]